MNSPSVSISSISIINRLNLVKNRETFLRKSVSSLAKAFGYFKFIDCYESRGRLTLYSSFSSCQQASLSTLSSKKCSSVRAYREIFIDKSWLTKGILLFSDRQSTASTTGAGITTKAVTNPHQTATLLKNKFFTPESADSGNAGSTQVPGTQTLSALKPG